MKVNGIIAEYNPFHNGHQYQLTDAKNATGADYTVAVMSGNFVQRGAPALLNKHLRAEMALKCGADLVLELPVYYAASSAEYFAVGAVSLLDKLGVVDHLCFGSECADLSLLWKIAEILVNEPESFTLSLRENLRKGMTYPAARAAALTESNPALSNCKEISALPNNILSIEYLKALLLQGSTIKPYTTLRRGAAYHEELLDGPNVVAAENIQEPASKNSFSADTAFLSSATGIRQCIDDTLRQTKMSKTSHAADCIQSALADHMPGPALEILFEALRLMDSNATPVSVDDFSEALHYKLMAEKSKGYTEYLDITEDLSRRITAHIANFKNFSSFIQLIKSRDMTHTRISRCLLHILLNIKKVTMEEFSQAGHVPYARVLGFRKEAAPLLGEIKKNSQIPMVTSLADASAQFEGTALRMLESDLFAGEVYESAEAKKCGRTMGSEYRRAMVMV